MTDILQTLQAQPAWERFMRHELRYIFPNDTEEFRLKLDIEEVKAVFYYHFNDLREVHQLAAIIDWLDSEGVYVNTETYKGISETIWKYDVADHYSTFKFNSRIEALRAGLEYAFTLLPPSF